MCLTLGVNILVLTTEIQFVLSYQCTFGTLVWRAKASMHLLITLVLCTYLYMYLISPLLEPEAISG